MKRALIVIAVTALLVSGCSAAKPAPSTGKPDTVPPGRVTSDNVPPGNTLSPTSSTIPEKNPDNPSSLTDAGIAWRQRAIGYPLASDDPRAKGKKVVMLTFDDGPASEKEHGATAEILDILKRENIKATFFVTGYGAKNLDLLKREIAEGHTIGTHTVTHANLSKLQTKEAIEKEILPVNDVVEKLTGKQVRYFRPPFGMYNDSHGYVKEIARERGFEIINWTTGSLDWQYKDPDKISDQVLKTVMPGGIVLMHDTHQWTAKALPTIIKGLREKGYEFVTIR